MPTCYRDMSRERVGFDRISGFFAGGPSIPRQFRVSASPTSRPQRHARSTSAPVTRARRRGAPSRARSAPPRLRCSPIGNAESGNPRRLSSARIMRGISPGARPRKCASSSFTHHEVRLKLGGHLRQFLDIGVLAVAGLAEQQSEAAGAAAHVIGDREKTAQTIRIVGVVDEYLHSTHLEPHHPAGIVLKIASRTAQAPRRSSSVRCRERRPPAPRRPYWRRCRPQSRPSTRASQRSTRDRVPPRRGSDCSRPSRTPQVEAPRERYSRSISLIRILRQTNPTAGCGRSARASPLCLRAQLCSRRHSTPAGRLNRHGCCHREFHLPRGPRESSMPYSPK